MTNTFDTIKQVATQLPQYLGNDCKVLVQEFMKHLEIFKTSFGCSPKALNEAAQFFCQYFERNGGLEDVIQELDDNSVTKEFYECAANIRKELAQRGSLDAFLNDLKSPLSKVKKNTASKARGQDNSPNFSYSDIRRYKENQQKSQLNRWKSEVLVEDDGDHADLDAITNRGLLEKCLHTPDHELSYEEFYTQKIKPKTEPKVDSKTEPETESETESKENTVVVLQGRLGVGKSQVVQYVACNMIGKNESNIILFIGQRSSAATKEGRQLLQAFKKQLFKRGRKITGKFYIIIDEPDADYLCWKPGDWEKLHSAAKYYQAKIILLIREGSNDEELRKYFPVNSANTIQLQESPEVPYMPDNWKQWLDSKKIPGALLDELRRLPLFRLPIDNRLWRLSNQTLSSALKVTLKSCFQSAYALTDYLYVNRLRDKEVHTGINRKTLHDEKFYRQCDALFQYVAFKLCENDGVVSWVAGTPDQLNRWSTLIDDGFVENILKINSRKGQQSQNAISGFWYDAFYSYFLVREIRDRLVSGMGLDQVLLLMIRKSADVLKYNMLADGLYDLPNDIKQKAIQHLKRLRAENRQFTKSPYKDAVTSLISLLRP